MQFSNAVSFYKVSKCFNGFKVKVFPYTLVRRGVPVREGTSSEPSACEVR